jgi:hypothetical protein
MSTHIAESGTINLLLFRGSGPGALEGYPLTVYEPTTKQSFSSRRSDGEDLVFFKSSRKGSHLVAVHGFGTKNQRIVETDLRTGTERTLVTLRHAAACYPALAPMGERVAAVVVAGRTDLPPDVARTATLVLFLASPAEEERGRHEELGRVGFVVAKRLPVTPIDWSPDGTKLYFALDDGGNMKLAVYDVNDEATTIVGDGVFPRVSGRDGCVAHIDRRRIVIRDGLALTKLAVRDFDWPLAWLDWQPDQSVLAVAEQGPAYTTRISLYDIEEDKIHVLGHMGSLRYLNWITHYPARGAFEYY